VYHSWFGDGSPLYDGASSTYGPVPGYLVGGPNEFYSGTTTGVDPDNEPDSKAFKDWNTGWPENSWEITEPAIYYQAAYSLLLSQFTTDIYAPQVLRGAFDYRVAPHAVTVQFNESVGASLVKSDFTLTNLTTAINVPQAQLSYAYNAANNTATLTYTAGILPDGNYRLLLPAANVADAAGNAMASPYTLDFFVLAGDANRDRHVTISDLGTLASNWQKPAASWDDGDFNYDGNVTISDLGILASNWQASLPVPGPAVTQVFAAKPLITAAQRSAQQAQDINLQGRTGRANQRRADRIAAQVL
jgi:hypothetical protein